MIRKIRQCSFLLLSLFLLTSLTGCMGSSVDTDKPTDTETADMAPTEDTSSDSVSSDNISDDGVETTVVEVHGVYADIDVVKSNEALTILMGDDDTEKSDLINTILDDPASYTPPVWYYLGYYFYHTGNQDDGAFFFYTGQLLARIDANLCLDDTSASAVSEMTNAMGGDINSGMLQDMDHLETIINQVIEYVENTEVTYDRRWISLHGLNSLSSEDYSNDDIILPQDQWDDVISTTINDYYQGFQATKAYLLQQQENTGE